MLAINMDDVVRVLDMIRTHLIVIAAILVIGIVVIAACAKLPKDRKFLIRTQTGLAMLLAVVVTANLICIGPMSSMLDLVSETSYLTEETTKEASDLVVEIAEEGIVLLENDGGILPLAGGAKLNVFGWASTNPCYGGTGSGALNDSYSTVTLLQGLTGAGLQLNTELSDFYVSYKADHPPIGMWAQDWTLPEPNVSLYTDEMMNNAKAFSDIALIVITRPGGEGADLPTDMTSVVDGSYASRSGKGNTYYAGVYDDSLNAGNDWDAGDHYLQLTNREEELVELVCSSFDNVIVVYNGANAFELGWVEDYSQIKGLIACPGAGQGGFTALGEIIAGAVNPSGRLVDTYVYDLKSTPWWNNFGSFLYDNMDEFIYTNQGFGGETMAIPNFVNYAEGIYVGYKFYETAAVEQLIDYGETVQYPFGYGLSYTTFKQEMGPISEQDGVIAFDVTVTNTGSAAGKDVVEVYYNPPYTDGGIEKAAANLVEFGKTRLLAPGESDTITIAFPVEDMVSYDDSGAGCYVLESGDYEISINADSHTVIDSQTYAVGSTVTYGENNKRESDHIAAVNQFGFARGDFECLSRAGGFANYESATAAPIDYSMSAEAKAGFYNNSNYLTAEATAQDEASNAGPITIGAKNGLTLMDMRGVAYDDPKWDDLLDQMTLDDMNDLISLGGFQTNSVDSIGKIRTNDNDGPASINNNFTGVGSVGFTSAVTIAATWNKELVHAFGDSIGKMANEMNTSGWYAPAMNIHRTAFAGRNFEYYSEDGMLSGTIAANAVAGAKEHGVYSYMKHFALNDQEGNRNDMLCTWSTEQAIREIYLKPFEMCVKDAGCEAAMSSFNYIGNRWAGGCSQLLKTVLREEWGFQGFVETDYFGVYGYMSADQAIRNGSDLMLVAYQTETNNVRFRDTDGAQQAMREASKNILYVVANSRAYQEDNYAKATATPIWRVILTVLDVAAAAALIGFELVSIKGYKKRRS